MNRDCNHEQVLAGQAVYSKFTLALYDWWVLGVSNRFIWKCPTHHLLDLYQSHITANHLDIGVGTGYFLDHCRFPEHPRLALLDLNANSLNVTAQRIRRYHPTLHRRNVLEPFDLPDDRFESIGLNYVLHCVPGTMQSKGTIFDNLRPYLTTGGIVFGSTLLGEGVVRTSAAKRLMRVYNRRGIFCNEHDDLFILKRILAHRFSESQVTVHGCTALFWART